MARLTPADDEMIQRGLCPYCKQYIKGWHAPQDTNRSVIKDHWKRCREKGVNPTTGHLRVCPFQVIGIPA